MADRTRRMFVGAISSGIVALAGCLSQDDENTETPNRANNSEGNGEKTNSYKQGPAPSIQNISFATPIPIDYTTEVFHEPDPGKVHYEVTVENQGQPHPVRLVLYEVTAPPDSDNTKNNSSVDWNPNDVSPENLTKVDDKVVTIPASEKETFEFVQPGDESARNFRFNAVPHEFVVTIGNNGQTGDIVVKLLNNESVIDEEKNQVKEGNIKQFTLQNTEVYHELDFSVQAHSV